jgi:hypothetical protein
MVVRHQRYPSQQEKKIAVSDRCSWTDAVASALVLVGFAGYFGLVIALMSDLIDDETAGVWSGALVFGVAALAGSATGLAYLKLRLLPRRTLKSDVEFQCRRTDAAIRGLVLVSLVIFIGCVTALIYIGLQEAKEGLFGDDDINLRHMVFWCVLAGIWAFSSGLVCLKLRLFLTLAWVVAACFFVSVSLIRLLIYQQNENAVSYESIFAAAVVPCLAFTTSWL